MHNFIDVFGEFSMILKLRCRCQIGHCVDLLLLLQVGRIPKSQKVSYLWILRAKSQFIRQGLFPFHHQFVCLLLVWGSELFELMRISSSLLACSQIQKSCLRYHADLPHLGSWIRCLGSSRKLGRMFRTLDCVRFWRDRFYCHPCNLYILLSFSSCPDASTSFPPLLFLLMNLSHAAWRQEVSIYRILYCRGRLEHLRTFMGPCYRSTS